MTAKILISACLMGKPVRYDGKGKLLSHDLISKWDREGRLVVFCPELAGGFAVPRPPAEIESGLAGADVLAGRARVIEISGRDVTEQFVLGAEKALAAAQEGGCAYALLIDGSPSCGSGFVYDGSFSGVRHAGSGVTAALLAAHGIEVFRPSEIEDLALKIDGNVG
ncbi:DUF523 domain-containing protein [Rhizobium sp. KVB221]|uniref:DUF523 domain-containing protein n=1 Tax=Rhizobium setariae TaxID=2801340 RepID=A0A936YL72_9HYPH|nr:DUF523 domain-containing protein [Rhizobium setariae]MBL0370772.1 DUF523 domain-containing protein [Rhizobium setariae]